jgi:hypothetical protein
MKRSLDRDRVTPKRPFEPSCSSLSQEHEPRARSPLIFSQIIGRV